MRWATTLVAGLLCSGCGSSTEPPIDPKLEAVTPTELWGIVGTAASPVPTIRASDRAGNPRQGVGIEFRTNNGRIRNAFVVTDSLGLATVGTWTLGSEAGVQRLTANAGGSANVVFRANVEAGPVASITKIGGDAQSAPGGTTLNDPLKVSVADAFGNPVDGAAVTYAILRGGGLIDGSAVLTNWLGIAISGPWTLGPDSIRQEVLATAGTAATVFTALASHWPRFLFVRDGYVTVSDGGEEARLTDGYEPAWSPDGERIAFVRRSGGRSDVYVMNADGSNIVGRTLVLDPGNQWGFRSPAWSPDGAKLAVTNGSAVYDGTIYLLSAVDGGTAPVRLSELASQPAWSPDGSRIAFVSLSGDDGYHELRVMNADGSDVRGVTQRDPAAIDRPTWSPDGQRIAFAKCHGGCDIHTISADGSSSTQLTSVGTAVSPAWAPDGERIGFTLWSQRTYEGTASIAVVRADTGGEVFTITSGVSVAWQP
jgi:tricorn protease-like protein